MAAPIIPRVIRGRLYFQTADVLFPTFAQAATAWAAAEAHRLDIVDQLDALTIQRAAALVELCGAGDDLTAQIRRLRRQGWAS
jgi:hypothetical protein